MKATKSLLNKIENLKSLKFQMDALKAQIETLENEIKEKMGEDESITLNNVEIVTFKSYTSNRFDTTSFKKDHYDLYNQYLKSISAKRFTIKK